MKLTYKPALTASSAFLAACALLVSGVAPATADSSSGAPTIDDFVAVADDALLDELAAAPEEDGVVTPAGGEISVAVTSPEMVAIASDVGDAGVLVSRVDNAADAPYSTFALDLPDGATAALNESRDVVSFFAENGEPPGSSQTQCSPYAVFACHCNGRSLVQRTLPVALIS